MGPFFPFNSALVEQLRSSETRYFIVGAGGWIGRACAEYLASVLGEAALERVFLFGSSARTLCTNTGVRLPVLELGHATDMHLLPGRPTVVLHCAFLTMDKVGGMSAEDYVARNLKIRRQTADLMKMCGATGVAVLSSGAVYDFLSPRPGRPADANLYGRLKFEDECYFAGIADALGANYLCPRVFNLSGPYINKPETYALASFILDALQGRAINIRANRPVMRAYMPVQTLIETSLSLLAAGRSPGVFDYAGGAEIEVGALAQLVIDVIGSSARIERPELDATLATDRYIGNGDFLAAVMGECGMVMRDVRDQVLDTTAYLRAQEGTAA
ncbi:NAD-dependent epimerase/dehydratase family protein [Uliginosibacterium sp. sgz301328]|uniref:NAD-dependent epimerase/dehydratase family protein n=1 Tax=Uliginosibacterium sp. sgz301328 TaxID=3243764 RepID=UPI00359EF93D